MRAGRAIRRTLDPADNERPDSHGEVGLPNVVVIDRAAADQAVTFKVLGRPLGL
jgi:hypothetical protein